LAERKSKTSIEGGEFVSNRLSGALTLVSRELKPLYRGSMEKRRRIPALFLHQTLPKQSCGENASLQDQNPPQDPVWRLSGSNPPGAGVPSRSTHQLTPLDAGFAFSRTQEPTEAGRPSPATHPIHPPARPGRLAGFEVEQALGRGLVGAPVLDNGLGCIGAIDRCETEG